MLPGSLTRSVRPSNGNCGLRRMKSKYPVGPFDEWADSYDHSVASAQGFPHEGYEKVLCRVVQEANPRPGMRILDLGVGTGNLAERFLSVGCKVWGIDFSKNMLDKARRKLPTAILMQTDLLDGWPVEMQIRFNRVVSTYALHHFDLNAKRRLVVRVSRQYLAQDGVIVIGDISFPTAQARVEFRKSLGNVWDDEEVYWAGDETIAAFTEAGLRTEYIQISTCGGVYIISAPTPPYQVRLMLKRC